MAIKIGDRLPAARFRVMIGEDTAWKPSAEIFQGKRVALFAAPGAFTNTCHKMHMPTIVQNTTALRDKGMDMVAMTAINDVFVMNAWKKASGADGVEFLADPFGEFAKAIGLTYDGSATGLGLRSKRYSMLVDDGVVKLLNVEDTTNKVGISSGEALLQQL
jgi:peroxiredoxin